MQVLNAIRAQGGEVLKINKFFRLTTAAAAAMLIATTVNATTLENVRNLEYVNCGVSQGLLGFSIADKNGKWTGLDVDVCRAIAAAVLGSAEKVKFTSLSEKERFTALQSGEVDVLSRNTTWTLLRDTALGLNFAGVNYYDGQGFMVRKDIGLKSAKELGGAAVCVAIGTTTELNLADFFRANQMDYRPVKFEVSPDAAAAYDAGKCDAYSSDRSALAAVRVNFKEPDGHMILPEVVSKEPLGPVVRHGDDQWLDIVRWSLYAMLEAEELAVSSKNVDTMKESKIPAVRRLLCIEGNMGNNLGVDNGWAYRIISQVGNYAESYERNVGPNTPLRLPRGVNKLWKDGGLHYPMPVR